MEPNAIRMKAIAINFNEIRVYLSKNYYNGISSKFYLKDLESDELILLTGDALDSSDDPDSKENAPISFPTRTSLLLDTSNAFSCFISYGKSL